MYLTVLWKNRITIFFIYYARQVECFLGLWGCPFLFEIFVGQ